MDPPIRQATAADVAEWTFLGWVALLDLDKYLRRGSPWEALERLHEARGHVWRLIAVANDVEYPPMASPASWTLRAIPRSPRRWARRPRRWTTIG